MTSRKSVWRTQIKQRGAHREDESPLFFSMSVRVCIASDGSDVDQVVSDAKLDHVDVCFEVESLHDVVFVAFHGSDRNEEFVGNFLIAHIIAPHANDFDLSLAECFDPRSLDHFLILYFFEVFAKEHVCNAFAVEIVDSPESVDRLEEFVFSGVGIEEPFCAGLDGFQDEPFLVVLREDEDACSRAGGVNLRNESHFFELWGIDVEEEDIESLIADLGDQVVRVRRDGFRLEFLVGREESADSLAHHLLFVKDTYCNHFVMVIRFFIDEKGV